MNFLRKSLSWIFLIAAAAFAVFVYMEKHSTCTKPIEYTLGSFDSRFGISKDDFIIAAEEATHVWEDAYGKDLFHFNAKATAPNRFQYYFTRTPVVVGLVYDSRQQNAVRNKTLQNQIDDTKSDANAVKQEFTALQNQYTQAKNEYLALLSAYQNRQADRATVESKRLQVNDLADRINSLVKKYNSLVGDVNSNVDKINETAGQEFEEGIYESSQSGEKITIFEFTSHNALVRVLAHEFGHALGLDHNNNKNSIMYYLNTSTSLTPTKDDLAALTAICKGK